MFAGGKEGRRVQALSWICSRRGQDPHHADRGHPAAQPRRRCGDRSRGNPRPENGGGTGHELEVVPRKSIEYKGALFEEMDVDAILARKPRVALVDELAHTNIEGSKHRKRYEDVSGTAGCGHRRSLHHEHPAPGERDPDGAGSHRDPGAGNRSRLGAAKSQRSGDDRPDSGGAAEPDAARRRLSAGTRGAGAGKLFPRDQL